MKITNNIPKAKTVELRTLRPGDCFHTPDSAPERVQVAGFCDEARDTVYVTRLCDGGQDKLSPSLKVIPLDAELIIRPHP